MEMCRLCLGIDDDHGYQKIMQGDFKIALEMDFVCGINVSCFQLFALIAKSNELKSSIPTEIPTALAPSKR